MAGDRLDQSGFGGRTPFQVNAVSRLAPGGNVGDLLAKDQAQNHRNILAEPATSGGMSSRAASAAARAALERAVVPREIARTRSVSTSGRLR